ncbi:Phthalate 4,5-dioxygenase oxygenase subunit [Variovorax sp. SRS16]|uniref:Rieske 2Fe-2S domain-containing protein n=1 Tax=Variovorax sp. SRS16 TaxID=282217 RepID=UPI001317EBA9|nr:Rieske 2Fe-2S domain-containing protein [Variovorax sp. SRS16]VTU20575.1 Phthalate 4,5-dioxygenase oxygenase subunit [Variovorax sp. SRS16]
MTSHDDNETLVRVGPGTAMGQLMRLYWIPFLTSSDVERDGQPYRVRLLGEDLVAFRDSSGKVGLVDHACPHRGAPMAFARNEEGGIRCIYHGWKFSTDGQCQEMPAEPPNSPMCSRMAIKSYPVQERNGVLWAYMGVERDAPPLPQLEWNMVSEENCVVTLRVQECNWLQALEGEVDSAHAAILHGRRDGSTITQWRQGQDLTPTFEIQQHDAGISVAARRKDGTERNYVRVNQFLMPFWTLVPPQTQYPELSGHAWVPIDDHHTLAVMFSYTPDQPFYEKSRKLFKEGYKGRETGHHSAVAYEKTRPMTDPYPTYWSRFNRGNSYEYDYKSGMPGLWLEDAACQSGVAAIYDRTQEHLGTTDAGIARVRRMLLENTRKLAQGAAPVSATSPSSFMKRAISITIPAGADWSDIGRDYLTAELGKGFGYKP